MDDAIVTVSTLKADPDQVVQFLERNLAAGADHMVVFLDEVNPPVRRILEDNPHVTAVRTGPRYWNGARPPRVSDRLRINMNVANAVLATVQSVGWLVSIDSDEVLCIDRDALRAHEARAVVLAVLEAVSQRAWPDDEPTLFKRTPTSDELSALAALGVIAEPGPASYFRGHYQGKRAVRPDLRLRLRVHAVVDETGQDIAVPAPDMYVLHYESYCLADFVRRWKDYAPGRAHLRTHRDSRKHLAVALHTLYHHDAPSDAERERLIERLFDREVADDLDTLQAMGLATPPAKRDYRPRQLLPEDIEQIRVLLDALTGADKEVFNEGGTPARVAAELERAVTRIPGDVGGAVQNIRRTLEAVSSAVDLPEP